MRDDIEVNSSEWHNRQLTDIINRVGEYYPLKTVIKGVTTNTKSVYDKVVSGGNTTLGNKPLSTLAKRMDCKLVLLFVPISENDESISMSYDIQARNEHFFETLEVALLEYCSNVPIRTNNAYGKTTIIKIRQMMELIHYIENDGEDEDLD